MSDSWLPRAAPMMGLLAAVLVGAAVPLAGQWLLDSHSGFGVGVASGTTLAALWSVWKFGPRVTSIRFGLAAICLAALIAWGLP